VVAVEGFGEPEVELLEPVGGRLRIRSGDWIAVVGGETTAGLVLEGDITSSGIGDLVFAFSQIFWLSSSSSSSSPSSQSSGIDWGRTGTRVSGTEGSWWGRRKRVCFTYT